MREDAGPKDIDMCTQPLTPLHTHTHTHMACLLYHLWNMAMNIHNSPYTVVIDSALLPRKHHVYVCACVFGCVCVVVRAQRSGTGLPSCKRELSWGLSLTELPLVFHTCACVCVCVYKRLFQTIGVACFLKLSKWSVMLDFTGFM